NAGRRPPTAKTAAAHLQDPMRLENIAADFGGVACQLAETTVISTSPPKPVLVSLTESLVALGADPKSSGARHLLLNILSGARSLSPGDSCRLLSLLNKAGLPLPDEVVERVVVTGGEGLSMEEISSAYEATAEEALGKWLEGKEVQEWTPCILLRVARCCSSASLANRVAKAALQHRKSMYFDKDDADLESFVIGVMHGHALKQDLHI
ncbi:hypothetical protein Pmar_PMAR011492, partial [Perkinsus marinus ATCC 50983]